MADEKNGLKLPHHLILEDRRKLTLTGISDVDRFDEQTVTVITDSGALTISGFDMHIDRLNIDAGELSLEGNIHSLSYVDTEPAASGFFSRLFK